MRPNEQIVRRRLVDDAICVGRSKISHPCKIERPDPPYGSAIQRGDAIRIREEVTARPHCADDLLQGCQFAGTEHERMTRQNLLDQRGARARHAENEHGQVGALAVASLLLQQCRRKDRLNPCQQRQGRRLIVVDLRALERIALQQMLEGSSVIVQIGVGLA